MDHKNPTRADTGGISPDASSTTDGEFDAILEISSEGPFTPIFTANTYITGVGGGLTVRTEGGGSRAGLKSVGLDLGFVRHGNGGI